MVSWKRNLLILVIVQIAVRIALNLIKPFLPLYLPEIGIESNAAVAFWAGVLPSSVALGMMIFSPMWGIISDRYGRKAQVIRCTLIIGIANLLMAVAANVYELMGLRFLMGAMAGYNASAIALIATTIPEKNLGYGVGMLQTGQMVGTIFGPAVGGIVAELYGYRGSFVVAGILSLLVTPVVALGVQENFKPQPKSARKKVDYFGGFKIISKRPLLLVLLLVIIAAQLGMQSADTLMSLFVKEMYHGDKLNLMVAFIYAASAFATVFTAPILGKWGDKHGSEPVLFFALLGLGLVTLPQAFVSNVYVFAALRFLAGACIGGVLPSVQAVLGRSTPMEMRGTVFGVSASAVAIGNFTGPIMGGTIGALFGIPLLFIATGGIILAVFGLYVIFLNRDKASAASQEKVTLGRS